MQSSLAMGESMKIRTLIAALTLLECAAGPATAQRTTNVLGVPLVAAHIFGDKFRPSEEDLACVRRGQLLATKPSEFAIDRNVIYNIRRDGIEQGVLECRKGGDLFSITTKPTFDQHALQTLVVDAGVVLFGGDREAIRRAVGECWKNVKPGGIDNIRWERADAKVWLNCHKLEGARGLDGYFKVNVRPADGKTALGHAPSAQGASCKALVATATKGLGGDGQSARFIGSCVQVGIECGTPPRHDTISVVTTCPAPASAVRAGIVSSLQVAVGHTGPQVKAFVDACLAGAANGRRPDDKEVGKNGLLVCTEGVTPRTVELQGMRQ